MANCAPTAPSRSWSPTMSKLTPELLTECAEWVWEQLQEEGVYLAGEVVDLILAVSGPLLLATEDLARAMNSLPLPIPILVVSQTRERDHDRPHRPGEVVEHMCAPVEVLELQARVNALLAARAKINGLLEKQGVSRFDVINYISHGLEKSSEGGEDSYHELTLSANLEGEQKDAEEGEAAGKSPTPRGCQSRKN